MTKSHAPFALIFLFFSALAGALTVRYPFRFAPKSFNQTRSKKVLVFGAFDCTNILHAQTSNLFFERFAFGDFFRRLDPDFFCVLRVSILPPGCGTCGAPSVAGSFFDAFAAFALLLE